MEISNIQSNIFKSKGISAQKQKYYTDKLSQQMETKSPLLKDFYKLNIDLVNDKIKKNDYLRNMRGLSEAIYNSKETMNMVEKHLIDSFRLFFDMYGCNQNLTTKSNIIEGFEWLFKV